MNKFNNSKIYKLYSESSGLTYIGSTCEKYLSRRLAGHVRNYKNYLIVKNNYITSFEILKCDDYKIELLKKVNVSDKDELRKIEGDFIRKIKCVNKFIAGRTQKEWREENKEYNKEYRKHNKDKIKEKKKEYYDQNKYKIKQHSSEKIECKICGSYVRRSDISTHKKSKKCLKHQ